MSILFAGNDSSNLSIPANNIIIGTNQFTIEWWQYQTDSRSFPRVFSIGSYATAQLAVSIEGGALYFWTMSSFNWGTSVTPYKNQWVHFAITRNASNQLRLFKNGTQVGSTLTNSSNITQTQAFRIANETNTSLNASFGGNITNFRIVIGTAVYTSNFTVPTSPLTAIAGTALLLLASTAGTVTSDSSPSPKTVTANSISWSSMSPFPAPAPQSRIGWLTTSSLAIPNSQAFNTVTVTTLLSGLNINTDDLETNVLNTNTLRVSGIVNTDDIDTGRLQVNVLDSTRSNMITSYSTLGTLAYINSAFVLTNGDRFGVVEITPSFLTFKYTKPADTTIYSYNLVAFN